MKVFAVLTFVAAVTGMAAAQDQILVDPDFGLTFETPEGFEAKMVGQKPEGTVLITVAASNSDLPPLDPSGDICEIAFYYDPAYGQGDQQWVNSIFDDTGAYEQMATQVPVPGTTEGSEDFTHRGSSSYRVYGQNEIGGAFTVATIPSPMGYVVLSCVSSNADADWSGIDPVIDGITMPGQPRNHLVAGGPCDMDTTSLEALLEKAESGLLDAATIAALDTGRAEVANNCGGLHADALMDKLMAEADRNGSYRDLRYKSLAQIGSDLLTEEQHVSLDGGRDEMVAINDEASGDRYVQYMHFIVGLRSLD